MNSYMLEPLEIDLNAPNGNYEVTVDIKAHSDTVFSVYSQNRYFHAIDRHISAGEEAELKFIVNVCDYHFYDCDYCAVPGIKISIASDGDLTVTAAAQPVNVPTVYICGDSTVTNQPAEYPYHPESTYCGWGQALPMLIKGGLAVSNHAQSGSCTAEFMSSNLTAFQDKIKPGDYMVIEFGHNDQKRAELDAYGGYKSNILKLAAIAREKGASVIVCSPINRIIFEPDGTLRNLLGSYRDAAMKAAKELNADFIDQWKRTTDYFETAGPVKSWQFFRCLGDERDYTHTNDRGGIMIAKFFAQEMLAANGVLAQYIDPELLNVEQIYADPGDACENNDALEHSKTIGLVNVPEDFDADITGLQK